MLLGDSGGRQTITDSIKNGEMFERGQRFSRCSLRKFGQCFKFSRYWWFSQMWGNPRPGLSLSYFGPLLARMCSIVFSYKIRHIAFF